MLFIAVGFFMVSYKELENALVVLFKCVVYIRSFTRSLKNIYVMHFMFIIDVDIYP